KGGRFQALPPSNSNRGTNMNMNQSEMALKLEKGDGFIAALDQSGGSTPKALKGYGVEESAWSNDEEMFDLIHQMRSRIITSDLKGGRFQALPPSNSNRGTNMNMNQSEMALKLEKGDGFIAALDQSGGSTPKALKGYGVEESAWSNDEEMFDLIHQMRSRIIT